MTPGYDERPRLQYNEIRTTVETDCTFSYDTPRGRVVGEVGAASNGAFIAVVCARPACSYTPALDTQCHVLVLWRGQTWVR